MEDFTFCAVKDPVKYHLYLKLQASFLLYFVKNYIDYKSNKRIITDI